MEDSSELTSSPKGSAGWVVDINAQNQTGNTALHYAAFFSFHEESGHRKSVFLLLLHQERLQMLRNKQGQTALDVGPVWFSKFNNLPQPMPISSPSLEDADRMDELRPVAVELEVPQVVVADLSRGKEPVRIRYSGKALPPQFTYVVRNVPSNRAILHRLSDITCEDHHCHCAGETCDDSCSCAFLHGSDGQLA